MGAAAFDGARRRDQRLRHDLTAKKTPFPTALVLPSEEIVIDHFEVEQFEKVVDSGRGDLALTCASLRQRRTLH